MKTINQEWLDAVIANHKMWLELPEQMSDKRGHDLRANMQSIDFASCNLLLKDCVLDGAILTGRANLMCLEIENVSFQNCEMNGIYAKSAKFKNCNFSSSVLMGSDFDFVIFENCNFSNVDFLGSQIKIAKIKDCNFNGADLTDVDFNMSVIENSDFTNAKFSDTTDFYKCEIKNCKYDKGLDVSNFKDFVK